MRKQFYEYLYLSHQERNGFLVMILFSILFSLAPLFYPFFMEKKITDFTSFIHEIESFNHAKEVKGTYAFAKQSFNSTSQTGSENKVAPPFFFDPNLASKEDFIQLGLSPRTAQTILNFRNKGAFFSKKEDFKKVYGLKSRDYDRLVNFIQIKKKNSFKPQVVKNKIPNSYDTPVIHPVEFDPNTANKKVLLQCGIPPHVACTIIKYRNSGAIFRHKEDLKKIYTLDEDIYQKIKPYIKIISSPQKVMAKNELKKQHIYKIASKHKNENIIIDINDSSPEDWQQLQGIGPSFSKKIVNYRIKLGGFHAIQQVSETYGLPDSTFQNIKPFLRSSVILKKINLNKISEDELKKHPYISWNQAKLIVSYRNMHGAFKNVNELLKIGALKKEWLEKIKAYFEI